MNRRSTLRLLRVASRELDRAMTQMRIPGQPRPFYIAYLVRDEEYFRVQAKYGSVIQRADERRRNAFVDVRVGSYRADQVREGGLSDNDKEAESYNYVELPFGDNADALAHGLWRLTDARYREAVESSLDKQSRALTYLDPGRHLPSFERRAPRVRVDWRDFPAVDRDRWTEYVERTSRSIRRYDGVVDSFVEFEADHGCRVFVNSEGSRLVECTPIWSVECYLWLFAADGHAFPWNIKHTVTDPDELPDEQALMLEIRRAVATLHRLAGAPTIRSFCGPALLEPIPAGLLIHEAVGHRLEGNRLLSTGEGQTFKDSLGQTILPPFLTIRDDPRLARWDGHSLVGHYAFDDEGVEAQSAELVERGRLT
ncbi:MAG TPA: metallopeptidase TldD-related protein, partial [Candidatus Polarisedimenticolaceae bacterium]|nr:metallopeptidase TldD-related protein [Candidatus Polarisedimenticolaceae bacterium]